MMAWQKNLGAGVAPDVAIGNGQMHITWGHQPCVYATYRAFDGAFIETFTIPTGYFPKVSSHGAVIVHNGEKFLDWIPPHPPVRVPGIPVGNNPTGISPAGIQFYQRASDGQFESGVYCGSIRQGGYRPTGIWECHDDGTYVMMDNAREPWAGGYVHTSGPVSVGEGGTGGTLVKYHDTLHILYPGDDEVRWPRVSVDGNYCAIVSWGTRGMRLWCGTLADVEALPLADTATPPVDPPVEPGEPPMPVPPWELSDLLSRYVARYPVPQGAPGDATDEACRQWSIRFAEQAAFSEPEGGYGMKRADPYRPIGKDTLAASRGGRLYVWDLLSGVATGKPALVPNPTALDVTGQVFVVVQPTNHLGEAPPVDPPVDPPVEPPKSLDKRVLALEEDLLSLREALSGWIMKGLS